jgi:hypothetical protein
LESSGRVEVLTGDILRRKALDRIVASAVAIDDEGQHIDLRPPEVADDIEEVTESFTDESVSEEDIVDSSGDESNTEEDLGEA